MWPAISFSRTAGATARRPTCASSSASSGWQRGTTSLGLTAAYADNSLTGNGLQEQRFLARDYASVYTKPDITDNRSPSLNLSARHSVGTALVVRRERLLPRHSHQHVQRRHQRRLARSIGLSAERRRAGRADGRRLHRISGERRQRPPTRRFRSGAASRKCCSGRRAGRKVQWPAESHPLREQHNYGVSGQVTWFGAPHGTTISSRRARAWDGNGVELSAIHATRLPQSRPQRDGRQRVRRRRDRRQRGRRAVRHARRSRTGRSARGASMRPTRCRWATRGTSRCPGATTGLACVNLDRHYAGRRSGFARRPLRVRPLQSRRGPDVQSVARLERLRGLQRRQPRADVDRTRLRRSRSAVQAAQRDGRRSAAQPGGDAHVGGRRARELGARACNWSAGWFRADNRARHSVRGVEPDRLRLLQEFRQDAAAGARGGSEQPDSAASRSAAGTRFSTRPTRVRRRWMDPATASTMQRSRAVRAWTARSRSSRATGFR